MDDAQCEDTDWEDYICEDNNCQCHDQAPVADALPTKPTLPLDKRHVQIELWLSADMKFLLMVLGFKSANGKHSCIFCTADLKQRQDWLDSSSSHRLRSEKDEVSSPVVVTPILTAIVVS